MLQVSLAHSDKNKNILVYVVPQEINLRKYLERSSTKFCTDDYYKVAPK